MMYNIPSIRFNRIIRFITSILVLLLMPLFLFRYYKRPIQVLFSPSSSYTIIIEEQYYPKHEQTKNQHQQHLQQQQQQQQQYQSSSSSSSTKVNTTLTRTSPNFIILFADDLGYGDTGYNGHPTTSTPNLDKLAFHGKIFTSWYSGCSVCSASRASLLTGRQYTRIGIPGVLSPIERIGLPLNEITIAKLLKDRKLNYTTAVVGKWHLGQRDIYLPNNHGFDYYFGIPYSDDMGLAYSSPCQVDDYDGDDDDGERNDNYIHSHGISNNDNNNKENESTIDTLWSCRQYHKSGYIFTNTNNHATNITTTTNNNNNNNNNEYEHVCNDKPDPAAKHLPLIYQEQNITTIIEQPLDFSTLSQKYKSFATNFIQSQQHNPFFLYVPFSHVHTTAANQPHKQYASCVYQNKTKRGSFGDALAEMDGIVGSIYNTLQELELEERTLILFASDNGPWFSQGLSAGSMGLLTGQFAGYNNTGKGSTWDGGIRSPSFAYWKGVIQPFSRSSEIVSSLDVLPTISKLAGIELPTDRIIDGKDMSDILLDQDGTVKSKHEFLFHYGTCHLGPTNQTYGVSAVRHGKYKAHFCTSPGLDGQIANLTVKYDNYPLLFDIENDPSESTPISSGDYPAAKQDQEAMDRIMKAYAMEIATFEFGTIIPEPDGPSEGKNRYGICCDRSRGCNCPNNYDNSSGTTHNESDQRIQSLFNMGTKTHHDRYHQVLRHDQPSPPVTIEQLILNRYDEDEEGGIAVG